MFLTRLSSMLCLTLCCVPRVVCYLVCQCSLSQVRGDRRSTRGTTSRTRTTEPWDAADITKGMNAFLKYRLGPNMLAYTPAGGIENVGIARAVNEMLVAQEGGWIELFPGWPIAAPAQFWQLRTKGGFLVSASYAPPPSSSSSSSSSSSPPPPPSSLEGRSEGDVGVGSSVAVTSTVTGPCTMMDPWPPGDLPHSCMAVTTTPPTPLVGGRGPGGGGTDPAALEIHVPSVWVSDALRGWAVTFNSSAGSTYSIDRC